MTASRDSDRTNFGGRQPIKQRVSLLELVLKIVSHSFFPQLSEVTSNYNRNRLPRRVHPCRKEVYSNGPLADHIS